MCLTDKHGGRSVATKLRLDSSMFLAFQAFNGVFGFGFWSGVSQKEEALISIVVPRCLLVKYWRNDNWNCHWQERDKTYVAIRCGWIYGRYVSLYCLSGTDLLDLINSPFLKPNNR